MAEKRTVITGEMAKNLEEMCRAGKTRREISQITGINENTVKKYTKGIKDNRKKWTDEDIEKMKTLAKEGYSNQDIANLMGAGSSTVQKITKGINTFRNRGNKITEDEIRAIINLYEQGKRKSEICRLVKRGKGSVDRIIKDYTDRQQVPPDIRKKIGNWKWQFSKKSKIKLIYSDGYRRMKKGQRCLITPYHPTGRW